MIQMALHIQRLACLVDSDDLEEIKFFNPAVLLAPWYCLKEAQLGRAKSEHSQSFWSL